MKQSIKNRLYYSLPIPFQHVACSWVGHKLKRDRFCYDTFEKTMRSGGLDHGQWCKIRDTKLRAFVEHCATTVPYYRRWFQEHQVDYKDIRKLSDLSALPIINKTIVKESLADFRSDAAPLKRCKTARTSGTTGSGMVFPVSPEAQQHQWAVWWRYRFWHGIRFDTWCAHFTNRPVVRADTNSGPFWRYNWPGRQILFSVNHTSQLNMLAYVQELRRAKPPWIHGIVSSVAYLADYIVNERIDLGYEPKFVTVGGDNLQAHQRKMIVRAFNVPVRMHYGLSESVANISERPDGRYYVDEDFAAVEFVPLRHTSGHRIIGTNFSNPAFPLLRYDTGDVASLPDDDSAQGRFPGRLVESIDGRLYDFIVLADGRHSHTLFAVFEDICNIREAQVRQNKPGYATVLIVPNNDYTNDDELKIVEKTKTLYGASLVLSFKYVETIAKTEAGKLRFIVSSCNQLAGCVR